MGIKCTITHMKRMTLYEITWKTGSLLAEDDLICSPSYACTGLKQNLLAGNCDLLHPYNLSIWYLVKMPAINRGKGEEKYQIKQILRKR